MPFARGTVFVTLAGTMLLAAILAISTHDAHAQGVPGSDKNKCLAGKTNCVRKKVQGLLKCREKCQKNPQNCGSVQMECEDKVRFKFERPDDPAKGCFARLEAKENPAKPETICTTTGDTADIESLVDALVADVVTRLESTCTGLGGVEIGGFCWFLGGDNESCRSVCSGLGLVYDDAGTRGYAGSDGTLANCQTVLLALGASTGTFVEGNCGGGGLGCVWTPDEGTRARCSTPPTDPDATGDPGDQVFRACACK